MNRLYRILQTIVAVAILLGPLLGGGIRNVVASTDPPPETTESTAVLTVNPRFLTLPFTDNRIRVQQGWICHWAGCETTYPDKKHSGIDYVLGKLSTNWEVFQVVAAAPGRATCAHTALYDYYVTIDHTGEGSGYSTQYIHLGACDSIPLGGSQDVVRGQVVGTIRNRPSGNGDGPHLHFYLCKPAEGSCLINGGGLIDPYATYATRGAYPYNNVNSTVPREVPGHFWQDWPPRVHSLIAPHITFQRANDVLITISGQKVTSRSTEWAFSGTASDNEGVVYVNYEAQGSNGNVTQRVTGTTSWNHSKSGLYGHNRIHFFAYDANGLRSDSGTDTYYIDLYVDAVAPNTSAQLTGTSGNNDWHRSPVQINLSANDRGSGTGGVTQGIPNAYTAGVDSVYYRQYLVGQPAPAFQSAAGGQAVFTVTGDGTHKVEYYALDRVGNSETIKTLTVKIDTTPPSAPGPIVETHGVASGEWQRLINDPEFTWSPAIDSGSRVAGYFITDFALRGGTTYNTIFDAPPVPTGNYTVTVRAFDDAGNQGPPSTFHFYYDGDAPAAPAIENLDGIASGVWQNTTRTASFRWPTPHDAGSGVAGYYSYWGDNPNGTSDQLLPTNTFVLAEPFCDLGNSCTRYLRVRSQDAVGWQSDWASFVTHYDGAPPTADLVANYGVPIAHQTQVHLAVSAIDLGSGVTQMRLSNGGYAWSDWRPLAEELYWEIPAIGRRNHDIYLQVTDAAGNLSSIISDTVYFDVNAPYPSSESFQLWQSLTPAGAGILSDTLHTMRVTVGQSSAAEAVQSTHYLLNPGFQAAALAIPTQTVTYTTYTQIGSLFASATNTATALASAHHRLYGSLGQPSDMRTVTSTNFTADLGFWAGAANDLIPQPPSLPEPPVPPECEFYGLSINNGALFTNSPLVTLNLCGPDPIQTMVSNDGGFSGAIWQPYTRAISWTLTTYGNTILPRFVYARHKDSQGYIHGNFMDDIIYDPTAPSAIAAFDPAELPDINSVQVGSISWLMTLGELSTRQVLEGSQAVLYVSASDDSSGLAAMQISFSPDFEDAEWQPFQSVVPMTFEGEGIQTVYFRTRDAAGNVSAAISRQVIVDVTPPTIAPEGLPRVLEGVVGQDTLTVTLTLSATDNIGVDEVRVSLSEAFTDTTWVPYAASLAVPVRFTGELTPTLNIQLRDAAGNESEVYITSYRVDVTPPSGLVEVIALDGTVATLRLTATDDLGAVTRIWISPDYLFLDNVTTAPYQTTWLWDFAGLEMVYIRFEDAVGNLSWHNWVIPEITASPVFEDNVYLPLVMRQQ